MGIARLPLLLVFSLCGVRVAFAGLTLDDLGGSLALTSDDIYHGISQTCGDPAVQGDVHYRSAGGQSPAEFFAGAWASAGLGQSDCGRARETNFYAGYAFATGADSSGKLTYTHYGYPGGSYTIEPLAGLRYDYDTLEAEWSFQDQLYLTAAWSPDALRYANRAVLRDRTAFSYGLQMRQPLPLGFSLSAGVGYDEIPDPFGTGYGFWNVGAAYAFGAAQLQVGYFGTATRAERLFGTYVAGDRMSVSLVWRF